MSGKSGPLCTRPEVELRIAINLSPRGFKDFCRSPGVDLVERLHALPYGLYRDDGGARVKSASWGWIWRCLPTAPSTPPSDPAAASDYAGPMIVIARASISRWWAV